MIDLSKDSPLLNKIGYTFRSPKLLQAALRHPSISLSRKASEFERLEFLGDRVLGLVIADLVYERYPKEKEGDLAKRLAGLVCREACLEIAKKLDLISSLSVVISDITPTSAILADAVEALIGAIYLDGGLLAAQDFVRSHWLSLIEQTIRPPQDAKTGLQEWAQANGFGIPSYEAITISGPAHAPLFTIRAIVGSYEVEASGSSKRQAEQAAAKLLFEKISLKGTKK